MKQPPMPIHSFRVSDELWSAAKEAAAERGDSLSDEIRDFLTDYINRKN